MQVKTRSRIILNRVWRSAFPVCGSRGHPNRTHGTYGTYGLTARRGKPGTVNELVAGTEECPELWPVEEKGDYDGDYSRDQDGPGGHVFGCFG